MRKLLGAATEKLAQDALLHILVFPDRGSEGIDQFVIEFWVLGKVLEFLNLPIIKLILMVVLQELVLDSGLILIDILHWLIFGIFLLHINIEALFI